MNEAIEQQIKSYRPTPEHIERFRQARIVILCGITGAGKDTIIKDIVEVHPDAFKRLVTSTTRAPRENNGVMEEEGVDYYFLTMEQALDKIKQGEYVEVANVHGRINGALIAEFEKNMADDKIILSDIDYQGVKNLWTYNMPNLQVFFITPPSFEVWLARLMKRFGDGLDVKSEEFIARLRSAQNELSQAATDERFVPILNDVSAETARHIVHYVLKGVMPDEALVSEARVVIDGLKRSIDDYIDQLQG